MNYTESILETPGLIDYWQLGESSGTHLSDMVGGNPLTTSGEPTLGAVGGVPGETGTSIEFDGEEESAGGPLELGGATALTIEFWMKWAKYANDDSLAMEYTSNFNDVPGGFLVDPNSTYGSFAVSLGIGASRNVALFAAPRGRRLAPLRLRPRHDRAGRANRSSPTSTGTPCPTRRPSTGPARRPSPTPTSR